MILLLSGILVIFLRSSDWLEQLRRMLVQPLSVRLAEKQLGSQVPMSQPLELIPAWALRASLGDNS